MLSLAARIAGESEVSRCRPSHTTDRRCLKMGAARMMRPLWRLATIILGLMEA